MPPYIEQCQRPQVDPRPARDAQNPGELNYQITMLALRYMQLHGLKYQTINDILGAMEGAKIEFYSRVAVPYEATKAKMNGDVYP